MNKTMLHIVMILFGILEATGKVHFHLKLNEPSNLSWFEVQLQNFQVRDESAIIPTPTQKRTDGIDGNSDNGDDARLGSFEASNHLHLLEKGIQKRLKRGGSGDRTRTLRRVVRALEKLTTFLVNNAEEANFDAMMGIRMSQGHFKQLLAALAGSGGTDWLSQSGINDWMQQTVTSLYVRLDTAANRIGRRCMQTDPEYFSRFGTLTTARFWQRWPLPQPSTDPLRPPARTPKDGGHKDNSRNEYITEPESDECIAELLPAPPRSGARHGQEPVFESHPSSPNSNSPRDKLRLVDSAETQTILETEEDQIDGATNNGLGSELIKEDVVGDVAKVECNISKMCWSKMAATPGLRGYSLTHQLLYLIIGRLAGCEGQLEAMSSLSPQPDSRTDIPNVILELDDLQDIDLPTTAGILLARSSRMDLKFKGHSHLQDFDIKQGFLLDDLMRDQCSAILWEAKDLADEGFPEYRKDLFMEQGFLCGMALFSPDYFIEDWVITVLEWQKPSGCYGIGDNSTPRSRRQTKNGALISRKTLNPRTLSRKSRSKEAKRTLAMNRRHISRPSQDGRGNKPELDTPENNKQRIAAAPQDNFEKSRYEVNDFFVKLDSLEDSFLENLQLNDGKKSRFRESKTPPSRVKYRRYRRSEQIMSGQCQAHRSAVALGYLSVALRYLALVS